MASSLASLGLIPPKGRKYSYVIGKNNHPNETYGPRSNVFSLSFSLISRSSSLPSPFTLHGLPHPPFFSPNSLLLAGGRVETPEVSTHLLFLELSVLSFELLSHSLSVVLPLGLPPSRLTCLSAAKSSPVVGGSEVTGDPSKVPFPSPFLSFSLILSRWSCMCVHAWCVGAAVTRTGRGRPPGFCPFAESAVAGGAAGRTAAPGEVAGNSGIRVRIRGSVVRAAPSRPRPLANRWKHPGNAKKQKIKVPVGIEPGRRHKQGIACIRLGNVHVIPVTSPEIACEFLKTYDAVFSSRPITMASHYVGSGFLPVFASPMGAQWKKMRRFVVSKVLNPTTLHWLLPKRVEEADNLVRYVYNHCCDDQAYKEVDVREAAWQYGGNVFRKMVFNKRHFGDGREDGGPGVEEEEHVEAIRTALSLINSFCVSDYMPWLRWLDLDGHERVMRRAIGVINKYHDPIIDDRIKSHESTREPRDLLDVLISAKDGEGRLMLSVEEIKAEVMEIMLAGFDNVANATEWALAEMVNQPETLKRALDEMDGVVGRDRLVQVPDLSHLNYLRACARETFRLHPIGTFILPHVSLSNITTTSGYFIPKGSHVLLSRLGLGRNPKVWDEPLQFRPERHFDGGLVQLTESSLRFVSFSTGRRGCPGGELGTEMTVMLLSRLLQGFNWSLPRGASLVDHLKSKDSFASDPLVLVARPRLPVHLYPTST
ncbi:hypothetical protein Sjap_015543 [Stephania japonica]|uniref:Cytochrome P450 n=1 Tax=Stephania japonica TaxID=461633 RepID=A0AAP0IKW7_9MAGN